jgi:ribose transport system substrate-binding protein
MIVVQRPNSLRRLAALLLASAAIGGFGCRNESETTAPPSGGTPPKTSGGGASTDAAGAFDKPRKAEGDLKIKVITNGISPFWDAMGKGVEQIKGELKVDASWDAPSQADNNAQKRTFEDAVAAGVDGIAVSTIQADAFASVIDSAIDKGIPVLTYDSDSPKSKRLTYIGTNNFEAGKSAGEAAVKLFPNGGKLVAFVGNMSAQNARDRFEGFKEAIKGKNIEFLQEPFEDDKDKSRAQRNVQDAITKYGDKINGFVGLYSYNGPAIVDEAKKNNLIKKVKIICFDCEPLTVKNLEANLIDATIVQKPYEFGQLTVKLLTLINRVGYKAAMEQLKPELEKAGMKVNGNVIDTGVEVVTPETSADFLKRLKEKGLESS